MSLDNDEVAELEEIIAAVSEVRASLNPRSREFIDDVQSRYDEHGADLHLSTAQWRWLRSLRDQA